MLLFASVCLFLICTVGTDFNVQYNPCTGVGPICTCHCYSVTSTAAATADGDDNTTYMQYTQAMLHAHFHPQSPT